MANRVESFSIRRHHTKTNQLVDWFKRRSITEGPNFSTMVLEALKLYKEKLDGEKVSAQDPRTKS